MKFIRSLGTYLAADFLCLFVGFTLAISASIFFRIASIIFTSAIMFSLLGSFAYKSAVEDRRTERTNNTKTPVTDTFLMAAGASFISIASWCILLASVLSDFEFYRWHKLLNSGFIQLFNFICRDASSSALSTAQVFIMLPLALMPGICTYIFRYIGYHAQKNPDK